MKYRHHIHCPKCGKNSQVDLEEGADLSVKCGDCLMEHVEVVDMVFSGRVREVS